MRISSLKRVEQEPVVRGLGGAGENREGENREGEGKGETHYAQRIIRTTGVGARRGTVIARDPPGRAP